MSYIPAVTTPAIARGQCLARIPGTPSNLAAAIAARVAEWPHGVVRTYSLAGNDRSASYQELWRRSGRIAAGLWKLCPHSGAAVVLLIEDAVDFIPAFWACIRGGFIAVPLMSAAREAFRQSPGDTLRAALDRLASIHILADETFAEVAAAIGEERKASILSLADAENELEDDGEGASSADPICLVPSSGSTGRLKLVALREDTLLNRHFSYEFKRDSRYLGILALDGVNAHVGVFLRTGSWAQIPASCLIAQPASVLDAIERYQITQIGLTNSALKRIIAAAEHTGREWKLGSLLSIGLGAEAVVPQVLRHLARFLERHGASTDIVRAGYGTTETGILVNGANPFNRRIHGDDPVCLGDCPPGVGLRIVGDGGEVLAEGEVGEVQVDSPQRIFSCYWGEPEATRESFTADGWWRTGDLGRLENGELSLHGRAKEVLILQGRKFSLAEIDAEIETVLAIGDRAFSCAVHWPGEATERLAVAFVSPDVLSGHDAALAENIRRAVARRFGFRPDPVAAASLDDIPMAANGKVRRLELGARIRSGMLGATVRYSSVSRPPDGSDAQADADIETRLTKIWRDVLGIDGAVDRNASFLDLGGDSLRSEMLYTAIEEQFGKQITADAFFASPTFANLLRLVAGGDEKPTPATDTSEVVVPWPLRSDLRNRLLMSFASWDGTRPTRDRLVAGLNTTGTKTPLFWVCQGAEEFRQLARNFGGDQPVYGFRSGLDVIKYGEDEIQAFALRYASEVAEARPEGPLFVGGNCQGALIALAVAQHLLRRRRHIPLLILMEWGFRLEPYIGPVLLVYGRNSIDANPYLRYRNPDLALDRAFAKYAAAAIPGEHGHFFDDPNAAVLTETLARHMREAERSSPTNHSDARTAAQAETSGRTLT